MHPTNYHLIFFHQTQKNANKALESDDEDQKPEKTRIGSGIANRKLSSDEVEIRFDRKTLQNAFSENPYERYKSKVIFTSIFKINFDAQCIVLCHFGSLSYFDNYCKVKCSWFDKLFSNVQIFKKVKLKH